MMHEYRSCSTPTINNTTAARTAATRAVFRPYSAALTDKENTSFRPILAKTCNQAPKNSSSRITPSATQKLSKQQDKHDHQQKQYSHPTSHPKQVHFAEAEAIPPPSSTSVPLGTSSTQYPTYYAASPMAPQPYVVVPSESYAWVPPTPTPNATSLQHQVYHLQRQIQQWEQWANGWQGRMDQLAADREEAIQGRQTDETKWKSKVEQLERANRQLLAQVQSLQQKVKRKRSFAEVGPTSPSNTTTTTSSLTPRRELPPWQVPKPLAVSPVHEHEVEESKARTTPHNCVLPCLAKPVEEKVKPLPLKKRRVRVPLTDDAICQASVDRGTPPPSTTSGSLPITPRLSQWSCSTSVQPRHAVIPVTPSYENALEMPYLPH